MSGPTEDRDNAGPTPARVLAAVRGAIAVVYHDTARPPRDVVPSALLGSDLGLDSLDLAQVVVLLERELGVDPFRDPPTGAARPPIRTVDDLVAAYHGSLRAEGTPDRPT